MGVIFVKVYLVCSRSYLLVFYSFLLLLLFLGLLGYSVNNNNKVFLSNDEERRVFLNDLGLDKGIVLLEEKDIKIPWHFSEEFSEYNLLQKAQNYDLSKLSGESLKLYTYKCDDCVIRILIKNDGEVVGGDISDSPYGGVTLPLCKESVNEINST